MQETVVYNSAKFWQGGVINSVEIAVAGHGEAFNVFVRLSFRLGFYISGNSSDDCPFGERTE